MSTMSKLAEIKKIYKQIKPKIITRLQQFEEVWATYSDKHLFAELTFCLLTPQSKARMCWASVERLISHDVLFTGTNAEIIEHLEGVRFHNNKTKNIIEARDKFIQNEKFILKSTIDSYKDVKDARTYLVQNVKGFGWKEASHFLRNIGKGAEITILDRHILRNLIALDVIDEIPKSLSPRKYIEIEDKMTQFAKQHKIPLAHLDIVLWYKEAGEIFK